MHSDVLTQHNTKQIKGTMQNKKETEKRGKKPQKKIKTQDLTPNKDAKGGGGSNHHIFGPPST
jgi:hypothetical protein